MPSKSMNQINKDKAFKTIAVFAMVFLFVASLLMAIVLPFVGPVGVADAITVGSDTVGKQFFSGITFANYTADDLNNVYGFFVNQDFNYVESECPFDYDSVTEGMSEISLFTYTLDGIGFDFKVQLYNQSSPELSIKGFVFNCVDNLVGGDFYMPYGTPNILSLTSGVPRLDYLYVGKYYDFGTTHIENFTFTTEGNLYKDYIGKIINFSWAFSSGSGGGISQEDYDKVVAENQELKKRLESLEADVAFSPLVNVITKNITLPSGDISSFSGQPHFYPYKFDKTATTVQKAIEISTYSYTSQSSSRPYLFGVALDTIIPSGADLKISFENLMIGCYSGGIVPNDLYSLGYRLIFYFGQYGFPSDTYSVQSVTVDDYSFYNSELIFSLTQPTSYIAFDVVSVNNNAVKMTGYYNYNASNTWERSDTESVDHRPWRYTFLKMSLSYRENEYQAVYNQAYNDGFSNGRNAGYQQGFNAGVNDNNDYSFFGLIGAVFDAPISAFKGLLSFEVFGVDMTAFVSSLFALAIIVVIIKIALGGGK